MAAVVTEAAAVAAMEAAAVTEVVATVGVAATEVAVVMAMAAVAAETSDRTFATLIFPRNNWFPLKRIFTWNTPMLRNEARRKLPTGEPPSRLSLSERTFQSPA